MSQQFTTSLVSIEVDCFKYVLGCVAGRLLSNCDVRTIKLRGLGH